MTLNITVLTPKVMYLSADYRLSRNGHPYSDPSTKLLILVQNDWTGYITYTGIGRIGYTDTSEFVKEWLKGIDPRKSIQDVAEIIRSRASIWLPKRQFQPHSFVFAEISETVGSRAFVISNFQSADGSYSGQSASFYTTSASSNWQTKVIFTGFHHNSRDKQFNMHVRSLKRALINVAQYKQHEPQVVRARMRAVNRSIAKLRPNLISEDCSVVSHDTNDNAIIANYGDSVFRPLTILNGTDIDAIIRPFIAQQLSGTRATVVAAGVFRIPSNPQEIPICTPVLGAPAHLRRMAAIDLTPLQLPGGQRARPLSANEAGMIAGRGQPTYGGPECPCIWRPIDRLRFLSRERGSANWISGASVVVGHAQAAGSRTIACAWSGDHWERRDLPVRVGGHSSALRGNSLGDIVGWVSKHPTEGGQLHWRPVLWPADGGVGKRLDYTSDEYWGEAVDINNSGQILVILHRGNSSRAFVWDGKNCTFLGEPQEGVLAIYPRIIQDDGSVVATVILIDGQRLCYLRYPDGRWRSMITPARGRNISSVGVDLAIAGTDQVDDFNLPWIKRDGSEIGYLDFYASHNHRIDFVRQDAVLGAALADYCMHPLSWTIRG